MLAKFLGADEAEWEAVVAAYRGDLQRPFFEHMQCLIAAARDEEGASPAHARRASDAVARRAAFARCHCRGAAP